MMYEYMTLDDNTTIAHSDMKEDISKLQKIIENNAHLILEFSQQGGFANASGF